ncbi:LysR family transcriptional regulator [Adlercreutzia sp. R25]|uniref:LysR family transcriptional regulator n=1 Tax=Adlercreutzia shanghongiae TaxID=3111773 RepID=A0ABU6IYG7_9ACTN|nr:MULTISPECIES: LysR family transcriptional regulator [unclassified Adlercreutzia]MEC4271811.1 LysR family transcriptional regulator [Adlercreutzia sp. R25]MEC4294818.1 LysR family transcriptional regulator [Adlercreutzia sp. R22]
MELRQLRYFVAIAREGSITNAAAKLYITQPTLSRQMSELEQEIGTQLLIRSKKRLALTADGESFFRHATRILDMADEAVAQFAESTSAIEGDVFIGCGESKNLRLVFRIIADIAENHPGIRVHITTGNAMDLLHQLNNGYFDFVFQYERLYEGRNECDSLELTTKNRLVCIVRKDHPLSQKAELSPVDLTTGRLAASRQAMNSSVLRAWGDDMLQQLNVTATYNLPFNGVAMVEAGLADLMLNYEGLYTPSPESPAVVIPLVDAPEGSEFLVWRKDKRFSRAAQYVFDHLLDELRA